MVAKRCFQNVIGIRTILDFPGRGAFSLLAQDSPIAAQNSLSWFFPAGNLDGDSVPHSHGTHKILDFGYLAPHECVRSRTPTAYRELLCNYKIDAIQSKMAKARSDAKFTEAKLKKVNEQIRYLGQYLSTKSVYGDFLKSGNKKSFRQAHAEDIAKYEEALRILKQHSPDGRFPTMKDLRAEKEQLTIQKDAQYDTYHYFKDYHRELQTVCANVDNILGTEREARREQQQSRKNEHSL